ncbi:putative ATP-dependent endonuclease of OLD family [Nocardioides aromaticivorans]|uniref:Putative ATP-dependent endonuclease of OLD family n=2 Tax=Nocardioides aromaticivorans TaxID=200618 RepID=A0A7Z0CMF9_9ACTN|nr:putative ATP-dependent endonuclease of OLD family [Nocardioides aromaticivorans]
MFAIEEPEAFLHPQTQRAMAKIIGDIADDAQVLVTTHSSVLVDSFDISRIARLPLQSGGTTYERSKPVLDPTDAGRLSRYCSAANSELVFANAVVFVEGEGDYSVVERLLSRACAAPGGHYALGVTVIEAGGVGKIQYLVQLANVFGIRSYVIVDGDAVRTAGSGKREVLNILASRHQQPSKAERDSIMQQADQASTTASQAFANQKKLNHLLSPFDVFVLSSDLEGLFLDALGVAGVVAALGPGRDGSIDASFASTLSTAPDAYEQLASWMGSRGWNSNRKKSGKLEPHLAPYLLDDCLALGDPLPMALQPLVTWLEQIIASVRHAPV